MIIVISVNINAYSNHKTTKNNYRFHLYEDKDRLIQLWTY